MISEEDFKILKSFIINENIAKYQTNKIEAFGSFNIEIKQVIKNTSYVLSDANISIEYFNKLILFLKDNNKTYLAKEFEWKVAMLSNPLRASVQK